jgi:hypothetical protein
MPAHVPQNVKLTTNCTDLPRAFLVLARMGALKSILYQSMYAYDFSYTYFGGGTLHPRSLSLFPKYSNLFRFTNKSLLPIRLELLTSTTMPPLLLPPPLEDTASAFFTSNFKSSMNGWPRLIDSAAGPTHDLYSTTIVVVSSFDLSWTIDHPLQSTLACPFFGYEFNTSRRVVSASDGSVMLGGAVHWVRMQLCDLVLHSSRAYAGLGDCIVAKIVTAAAAVVAGVKREMYVSSNASRRDVMIDDGW